LWPSTVVIGLFPGLCWIKLGKESLRRDVPDDASVELLLQQLDELLDEMAPRLSRFACAEVYLSDRFSRCMLVPWQPALDSDEQVRSYGRACLEASGGIVDGEWAVHCGFRHHGAPGFAAGLPSALVGQVKDRLAARNVRLRSFMPVAAAAYWYYRTAKHPEASILLLEEPRRLTAFVYLCGQLTSIDLEPVLSGSEDASTRLFNRLQLAHGKIAHVNHWTSEASDVKERASSIAGATVAPIFGERWSVS
jgi:hypothetical protein